MSKDDSRGGLPTFQMGLNDFQVMRTVIQSYIALARRTMPPSRKRDEEIAILQGLYRRFSGIPAHALEAQITLLVPEVHALNHALLGFMNFVRQKTPPSQEREATLRDLERFRRLLVEMMR